MKGILDTKIVGSLHICPTSIWRQNFHQSCYDNCCNEIKPFRLGSFACARFEPVDVGAVREAAVGVAIPLQIGAAIVGAVFAKAEWKKQNHSSLNN